MKKLTNFYDTNILKENLYKVRNAIEYYYELEKKFIKLQKDNNEKTKNSL